MRRFASREQLEIPSPVICLILTDEWKEWRDRNWLLKDCWQTNGFRFGSWKIPPQCKKVGTLDYGKEKCQEECRRKASEGCNAVNIVQYEDKEKRPLCLLLKCPQPFPEPFVFAFPGAGADDDQTTNGFDCFPRESRWSTMYGHNSRGFAYAYTPCTCTCKV